MPNYSNPFAKSMMEGAKKNPGFFKKVATKMNAKKSRSRSRKPSDKMGKTY